MIIEIISNNTKELEIMKDRNNTFVTVREDKIFSEDENTLLKLYTIEDDNGKKKDSLKEEKFAVQAINGLLNLSSLTSL